MSGDRPSLPAEIHVDTWRSDRPAAELPDWWSAGQTGQGIAWIDIGRATEWEAIGDALGAMSLPAYEQPMLGHVLAGIDPKDEAAERVPWYSADVARRMNSVGQPEFLTAFGLQEEVAPGPYDPPWVFIQPVHFLVGGTWLLTNRVPGMASDGVSPRQSGPFPRESLSDFAQHWWGGFVHPGDFAMLLLRALVESYRPALAALDRRLADLQLGYVRGRDDPGGAGTLDETSYRTNLLQVKWVVDGISRSLVRLTRPATDPARAWFALQRNVDGASEVHELLERAEVSLSRQREELRESFALIAAIQASEQLTIGRELQATSAAAEARARDFETIVQYAAAGFLAPALVAAIIGALPGIFEHNLLCRGLLLGGAVVLATAISFWLLHRYRARTREQQ